MSQPTALIAVIPAYNEEGCIERVITEWNTALKLTVPSHRIIVINDGSRDSTGKILDNLAQRISSLTVLHQPNGGHGQALLNGYHAALKLHGEWIFQVDSDDQFEPSDFSKLWERRHTDRFILGHRAQRNDPKHRLAITKALRLLLNILFGADLADANVPFRLMHSEVLQKALHKIPSDTLAPNIFLSVICSAQSANPVFVPVKHKERGTGKVSIVGRRLLKSLGICCLQLFKLRARKLAEGID